MVEEVAPSIFRLEIPLPRNPLKYLNSYLIKGQERNMLIDTGFNRVECRNAMFEGLKALGVNMEETDIFVTHVHADHSGLVPTLVTDSSTVYCSEKDAPIINYCVTNNGSGSGFLKEMYKLLLSHAFPLHELDKAIKGHPARKYNMGREQVFKTVKENDTLQVGDYIFKCVETPGHSPGHMCLYDKNKNILISGDHILDPITPVIKITKWASDPLRDYLKSLEKIDRLDVGFVLPAHRLLINNAHKRICELKQHHEARLNEVLNILDNSKMTSYEVASKMTWDIKYDSWEHYPATQKYFAVTEAISHLIYLCNKNMVREINDNEGNVLFELIN